MDGQLVLRGGTLVDGTGAPGRTADVAVRDGTIVAIGPKLSGTTELDASGQVVAPGFIDIHTHYDAQVFWDPDLTPSSFHGVTTVVAGNCGFSIAPIRGRGSRAAGPDAAARGGHELRHAHGRCALGRVRDRFPSISTRWNGGACPSTTAVTSATPLSACTTMGADAYERPATSEELVTMAGVVDQALDAGAIGFATSWSPTHNGDHGRPVPSRVADLTELRRASRAASPPQSGGGGPAAGRGPVPCRDVRAAAPHRPPIHLDGAAHLRRVRLPRDRSWRITRRPRPPGWRSGPRCRADRWCSR